MDGDICPILGEKCIGEKCAWFNVEMKDCAVVILDHRTDGMYDMFERIEMKL